MKTTRSGPVIAAIKALIFMTYVYASAQTPGSDASGIIRRANVSMGCDLVGRQASIRVEGVLSASSLSVLMPIKINTQGSDHYRSELDTPKERKTTVINGGRGQIQHGDGQVTALAEHNTSHQHPLHIPCLTNIGLPPDQVDAVFLRTERAGSDFVDVVNLELSGRPKDKQAAERMKTTVWISRSAGYLVKLQYLNASEQDANDTQLVEIEYSDYRVTDGLAVPFHQVTRSGHLTLDLRINSVQLNAPIADFNLR